MASQLNFSVQIDEWTKEALKNIEAVFHESTQRTFSRITQYLSGELVNVQTGFLRASAQASLESMPAIDSAARPNKGSSYAGNFGGITATIASAKLGGSIYIGWTAAYGPLVHDGTSKMSPRPFVSLAAMQWPATVNAVVQEVKAGR